MARIPVYRRDPVDTRVRKDLGPREGRMSCNEARYGTVYRRDPVDTRIRKDLGVEREGRMSCNEASVRMHRKTNESTALDLESALLPPRG
jgi:hypothetical protein